MEMLTLPIPDISRVEKLKNLKGFKCHLSSECIVSEIFWINKDSDTKEYDWLGLVMILEKYKNEWYIVGLFRDRWII